MQLKLSSCIISCCSRFFIIRESFASLAPRVPGAIFTSLPPSLIIFAAVEILTADSTDFKIFGEGFDSAMPCLYVLISQQHIERRTASGELRLPKMGKLWVANGRPFPCDATQLPLVPTAQVLNKLVVVTVPLACELLCCQRQARVGGMVDVGQYRQRYLSAARVDLIEQPVFVLERLVVHERYKVALLDTAFEGDLIYTLNIVGPCPGRSKKQHFHRHFFLHLVEPRQRQRPSRLLPLPTPRPLAWLASLGLLERFRHEPKETYLLRLGTTSIVRGRPRRRSCDVGSGDVEPGHFLVASVFCSAASVP